MKYFSLFSGVGGFELGIQKTYEKQIPDSRHQSTMPDNNAEQRIEEQRPEPICVGFSEIDKYAISVYQYHYQTHKNYGDISQIDWNTVPDFDLVVGGSPCQDLSVAGHQQGLTGKRSGLFFEYIRCLKEKQPTNFVWENVKGALSSSHGNDFALIQTMFSEVGYDIEWQVLNAKDFGVPQNRERIFIVGHLRGKSQPKVFPIRTSNEKTGFGIRRIAHNDVFRRYNQTYDPKGQVESLDTSGGGGHQPCVPVRKNNGKIEETKDEALCIDQSYHKGLDNHGQRTGIAVRQPLKFLERNQKNIDGDYAFTVDSTNTGGIKIGTKIRRLTPMECERLMGWPDEWTKYGIDETKGFHIWRENLHEMLEISDTQRYKMCGNGVVSTVVQEIIKRLYYA